MKRTLDIEAAHQSLKTGSVTPSRPTSESVKLTTAAPPLPPPQPDVVADKGASESGTLLSMNSSAPQEESPPTIPSNTQITITPEMFALFLQAPETFYCMVGAVAKPNTPQDPSQTSTVTSGSSSIKHICLKLLQSTLDLKNSSPYTKSGLLDLCNSMHYKCLSHYIQ